jgi:hypothetical protein
MRGIARKRNGKCLSTEYKNAHTKLKWECSLGHQWKALPCNISQGKWCPYCKSGKNEERCRFILEQLTGFQFLKTRSVINGELDGFCEHLNLAFEYQGIQHFEKVPFFRQSLSDVQSQDAFKRSACQDLDITLIEIPYFVAETSSVELEQSIRDCLSRAGIQSSAVVDYSQEKVSLIERINQIRKGDGIQCIGIDRTEKGRTYVKMICSKSHEWTAQSYPILYKNSGCPFCAGQKRTIQDVKLIAAERGGKCLSASYVSATKKMKWKCSMKHEWMASLNKILCGRWCPECAKKTRAEKRRLNKGYSYEMIRQSYRAGESVQEICSKFQICPATVKLALKG